MKHLTYTPGTGGNFIACLLCHSKYGSNFKEIANNEFGCEKEFKHGVFSHYITSNPAILIHEPNKELLFKKSTILIYKRYKNKIHNSILPDVRDSIKSLKHNGEYEFPIQRQLTKNVTLVNDLKYIYTWEELFSITNTEHWREIFDFFKCDFNDDYLMYIENYYTKNTELFNSDDTARIREFLEKYT